MSALPQFVVDHDLAEGAALTDVGEGLGYVVEPERAVDVDADVTGDAQVGQRLEVGRPLLHGEHPHPATGEPAGDPADRHDAQQRSHGPADAAVTAAAGECSAVGEHRPVRDEIEDEVVRLGRGG